MAILISDIYKDLVIIRHQLDGTDLEKAKGKQALTNLIKNMEKVLF